VPRPPEGAHSALDDQQIPRRSRTCTISIGLAGEVDPTSVLILAHNSSATHAVGKDHRDVIPFRPRAGARACARQSTRVAKILNPPVAPLSQTHRTAPVGLGADSYAKTTFL